MEGHMNFKWKKEQDVLFIWFWLRPKFVYICCRPTPTQSSSQQVITILSCCCNSSTKGSVIKGKFGPNLTFQHKRQAWVDVTVNLNAAFPSVHRTKEQVEKKWHNSLAKGKWDLAARNQQITKTGKIYYFCKKYL